MKKLICIMIALLIPVAAFAEVDLTGMSYDELVQLKDQVSLAIWESEEWQEVEVPAGVYTVGEDIPAGKWTIKAADGISVTIEWGDLLDDSGVALSWDGKFMEYEYLRSENNKYYEKGDNTLASHRSVSNNSTPGHAPGCFFGNEDLQAYHAALYCKKTMGKRVYVLHIFAQVTPRH